MTDEFIRERFHDLLDRIEVLEDKVMVLEAADRMRTDRRLGPLPERHPYDLEKVAKIMRKIKK